MRLYLHSNFNSLSAFPIYYLFGKRCGSRKIIRVAQFQIPIDGRSQDYLLYVRGQQDFPPQ